MEGFGPSTFRLQGECSSQAELHWHELEKKFAWFKMFSKTQLVDYQKLSIFNNS